MIFGLKHPCDRRRSSRIAINVSTGIQWINQPAGHVAIVAISNRQHHAWQKTWVALSVIFRLRELAYDPGKGVTHYVRTDTMTGWLVWLAYVVWIRLWSLERKAIMALYLRCAEQGLVTPPWRLVFSQTVTWRSFVTEAAWRHADDGRGHLWYP